MVFCNTVSEYFDWSNVILVPEDHVEAICFDRSIDVVLEEFVAELFKRLCLEYNETVFSDPEALTVSRLLARLQEIVKSK